ncbi:MAG: oligosaccharide flippase family protein [Collinsella sp.]
MGHFRGVSDSSRCLVLPYPRIRRGVSLLHGPHVFRHRRVKRLFLFCRGIDEVRAVAVSSIVNSVITLTCNIVFLTVFRWGLTGYLMANTIGSAIAMVYMFVSARLYRFIDFKPNHGLRTEMYLYSFPLIFSVVAWWVNSASDRYILSWICGVGVSGVYAVAYKIPSILSMFGNVFSQAWSISAIKEFDPDDSDGFFGRTFGLMIRYVLGLLGGDDF